MMLTAWFLSRAALLSDHECALSQVGTHPHMTSYVAGTLNNKHTYIRICLLEFFILVAHIWVTVNTNDNFRPIQIPDIALSYIILTLN